MDPLFLLYSAPLAPACFTLTEIIYPKRISQYVTGALLLSCVLLFLVPLSICFVSIQKIEKAVIDTSSIPEDRPRTVLIGKTFSFGFTAYSQKTLQLGFPPVCRGISFQYGKKLELTSSRKKPGLGGAQVSLQSIQYAVYYTVHKLLSYQCTLPPQCRIHIYTCLWYHWVFRVFCRYSIITSLPSHLSTVLLRVLCMLCALWHPASRQRRSSRCGGRTRSNAPISISTPNTRKLPRTGGQCCRILGSVPVEGITKSPGARSGACKINFWW
jgi:hypothetical protein